MAKEDPAPNQDKLPTIAISQELAQATLNYLSTRPYNEVWQLITAFQQAANK